MPDPVKLDRRVLVEGEREVLVVVAVVDDGGLEVPGFGFEIPDLRPLPPFGAGLEEVAVEGTGVPLVVGVGATVVDSCAV